MPRLMRCQFCGNPRCPSAPRWISLLFALATAADVMLRAAHQDDSISAWMNAMSLYAPALWTAGSPMRHPETLHPGVDLRFGAGLVTAP